MYREFFEQAQDAIIILEDGVLVDCNPAAISLLGYERKEELLQIHPEQISPEFQPGGRKSADRVAEIKRIVEERGAYRFEWDHLRRDGSIVPCEISMTMIKTDRRVRHYAVLRELVHIRRVEQGWLEIRELLQMAMDHLPVGIALNSVDPSVEFQYVNENFLKLYGIRREQLSEPDEFWNAVYEDPVFRETIKTRILRDCASGNPDRMHWDNVPIVHKGKPTRYISARNTPVEGRPMVISTVWDVTERYQAELELERLIQAIDQSVEIIVITDAAVNIQYVNPAFERITGYSRKEVLGKNPRILKSGKQDPQMYKKMWKELSSGKSWAGRFINKKKDGTFYTEDANIAPVFDLDRKIVGYVGAMSDITHHLEVEEQLRQAQKMEAVGHLAGGVAHYFNNLLQVIFGYVEHLQLFGPEDGAFEKPLEEIFSAAKRGRDIVAQLLAFSRKQMLDPKNIDLNDVTGFLMAMIRSLVGEAISVSCLPASAPAIVCADQGLIEQVLVNLCVNARDAMPEGGKLTVEIKNLSDLDPSDPPEAKDAGLPCVSLTVTDTGCGMDEETVSKIFEPFFTTKEVGKGTGLGLSMVYGIVKQHHGTIHVSSVPAKGTVFKIYLPAARQSEPAAVSPSADSVRGGSETILLAEDDAAVRALTETILCRAGYTVYSATNGKEALQMFEEHSGEIDMVLLDMLMPQMSGRDVLRQIRALRPGMPCLAVSGYEEEITKDDLKETPELSVLGKPYRINVLLNEVRRILDSAGSEKNKPV